SSSTLIVKLMPSPVHESVTDTITSGFIVSRASLPRSERNFNITTNESFRGFARNYSGSCKVPDLAVEFTDTAGDLNPKFVVEVAHSDTYEDLLQDARLRWEGTDHVSVVVHVKFVENPK